VYIHSSNNSCFTALFSWTTTRLSWYKKMIRHTVITISISSPCLVFPINCRLVHLPAHRRISQTPASQRRRPVAVSARYVISLSRTRLGDRSFDVARPRLWYKLPASLRSSDSLCQFRRQLKTFLFVKD